jgi:DNA polymerase-3 subunit alpha
LSASIDKDDVEKVGLVKFDFLGLRNLTIIELAAGLCSPTDRRERPDLECRWRLTDPEGVSDS